MATVASVGSNAVDQNSAVVPYKPRARMEGIVASLPQLPPALHGLVFAYDYEFPAPRELIKKVLVPFVVTDCWVVLKFDRIAEIFKELAKIGTDFGISHQVTPFCDQLLQTRYKYCMDEGVFTPHGHQEEIQQPGLRYKRFCWQLNIREVVLGEMSFEEPAPSVKEIHGFLQTKEAPSVEEPKLQPRLVNDSEIDTEVADRESGEQMGLHEPASELRESIKTAHGLRLVNERFILPSLHASASLDDDLLDD